MFSSDTRHFSHLYDTQPHETPLVYPSYCPTCICPFRNPLSKYGRNQRLLQRLLDMTDGPSVFPGSAMSDEQIISKRRMRLHVRSYTSNQSYCENRNHLSRIHNHQTGRLTRYRAQGTVHHQSRPTDVVIGNLALKLAARFFTPLRATSPLMTRSIPNTRLSLISRHLDNRPQLELNTPFSTERQSSPQDDLEYHERHFAEKEEAKKTPTMSSQPSHPALLIPGPIEFDDEVLQAMSHFR